MNIHQLIVGHRAVGGRGMWLTKRDNRLYKCLRWHDKRRCWINDCPRSLHCDRFDKATTKTVVVKIIWNLMFFVNFFHSSHFLTQFKRNSNSFSYGSLGVLKIIDGRTKFFTVKRISTILFYQMVKTLIMLSRWFKQLQVYIGFIVTPQNLSTSAETTLIDWFFSYLQCCLGLYLYCFRPT